MKRNRQSFNEYRREPDEAAATGRLVISQVSLKILGKSCSASFGVARAILPAQSMDQISATAASGLRARMEALDILSNNLANSNTGGFKLDREFYSLYQGEQALPANGQQTTTLPVIQKGWTDFQQGLITPTDNPLDLALSGKGFFAVDGPSGPLYTRNGAFKLSPAGVLTTADGFPVRSVSPLNQPSKKIQAASQGPIQIAADGTVQQDGQTLGQIQVVDFTDTGALSKVGNSYYRVTDPKVKGTPATDATVGQGKIENSNVAPAESAVRLVDLMRQYEMLQKAVSVAADMSKQAIDQVARVGA
ncbi:MAG: flagellar basal body rod protein [Bryobacterales bacterium]|nr:flagellar basal body rod protein [Bryobacterales bacterium]